MCAQPADSSKARAGVPEGRPPRDSRSGLPPARMELLPAARQPQHQHQRQRQRHAASTTAAAADHRAPPKAGRRRGPRAAPAGADRQVTCLPPRAARRPARGRGQGWLPLPIPPSQRRRPAEIPPAPLSGEGSLRERPRRGAGARVHGRFSLALAGHTSAANQVASGARHHHARAPAPAPAPAPTPAALRNSGSEQLRVFRRPDDSAGTAATGNRGPYRPYTASVVRSCSSPIYQ